MKILFIAILLFVGTCFTYSQEVGVQAGVRVNTSGIEYPGVDIDRKVGFEGGIFYQQNIGVMPLSIHTGLLYLNNEFSLENDLGNNTGITYHFIENSLKLPLGIEWRPFSTVIKPFLQAGLYTSCSVSGKIKDSDSRSTLEYKKSAHRFDYGVIVGIGFYLTSHITLNANYENGFADRDLVLGNQYVSVKNRGYSFRLNYLFKI